MACEAQLKPRQTAQQRIDEVRAVVAKLSEGLASGRIKAVVGPQGAVAFPGLTDSERNGVSDACVYRKIMTGTSALAKQAIARAEQLAGRTVDKAAVAAGWHAHSGIWHRGH